MSKAQQTIKGAEKVITVQTQAATKKKTQKPISEQEKAERIASGRTQGREGCKMSRINFALTVDNDSYVRLMSKARGENMTDFINHCIEKHREQNIKEYNNLLRLRAET